MRPIDTEALEQAAWQAFVDHLGDHLAGQWPAMPDRLGDRYEAFIALAVETATQRGLRLAASVARYVNLCFVWGPSFHDKPGFEWAHQLLAGAPEEEWLRVHQLVKRSLLELQSLPGTRVDPATLLAADERVLDTFGRMGRKGAMHVYGEPQMLPRAACDLEAIELRPLEEAPQQEYQWLNDDWQRVALPFAPPLRVHAAEAMPAMLGFLSAPPGEGAAGKLQLRARSHAVCDGDVHPVLHFDGPHGRWEWAGHETRAVNWPVVARPVPEHAAGPGSLMAEETSPEYYRVSVNVCGLRDQGEALGSQTAPLAVWPASQWWVDVQRAVPQVQALLPGPRAWQSAATRCRVERDGHVLDGDVLKLGFESGLDTAVGVGLQQLATAWGGAPGMAPTGFDALLGLLVGRMSATWGWRLGAQGLGGQAFMRSVAHFELDACQADLSLAGEWAVAETRTRVVLRAVGTAPMPKIVAREDANQPLLDTLLTTQTKWRYPFELTLEPLATESSSLLQLSQPVTGALVGEAGWRPSSRPRSGWEWYARVSVEPVVAQLQWLDPLLGQRQLTRQLLPELTLVDWSLG